MKKFIFTLQKLLDYKIQVLDAERATLAEMNAVLRSFEDTLASLRAERARRSSEYQKQIAAGITPVDMQMHRNYLRTLDDLIFQKEVQIDMQRKVIDKQMDKVRETNMDISTMEKLKETRLEEYNYLERKEQELFIEEFISNKKVMSDAQ
ncbi:MAG: flagellar export protein FliJ [Oscillospiraceae bacterium]|nr:flagellar export protein FliJ [Oscillospiraceae bacterium]